MTSIFFRLREDTRPGDKGAALKEICSIRELFNVQPAFPGGEAAGSELFYKAEVAAGASLRGILRAVEGAPFVASVRFMPFATPDLP
jgi:hypothetical protein